MAKVTSLWKYLALQLPLLSLTLQQEQQQPFEYQTGDQFNLTNMPSVSTYTLPKLPYAYDVSRPPGVSFWSRCSYPMPLPALLPIVPTGPFCQEPPFSCQLRVGMELCKVRVVAY
jgi:hypothetical protein